MKKSILLLVWMMLLSLQQCNLENEEDLYYEPLVEGIYNIRTDRNQEISFTIEPHKPLEVQGEFNNGMKFSVEFGSNALKYYDPVEASVFPVTEIMDMPSDWKFHFGFIFAPEGIEFNRPGKMTIELPDGMNLENLKGFYFQGGVPYDTRDAEIWSVRMTPIGITSENGKMLLTFDLPHFSGFVGVSGSDFSCGNPVAAETCEDLKEILACYLQDHEAGINETLTNKDQKKLNAALYDWLEAGLDWLEENPEEMDEEWELENMIRELLCWKGAALMVNSTLDPFEDQLDRAGDLITGFIVDKVVQLDTECADMDNLGEQAYSFGFNGIWISLLDELRNAGMLSEDPGIDVFSYCDAVATKYYIEPFMDTSRNDIRFYPPFNYQINFGGNLEPAVARSKSFRVFARDLLGQEVELTYGEDYTIDILNTSNMIMEGTTITEELSTCYEIINDSKIPYPCYPIHGVIDFYVRLTQSGDVLHVKAGRYLW